MLGDNDDETVVAALMDAEARALGLAIPGAARAKTLATLKAILDAAQQIEDHAPHGAGEVAPVYRP